MKKAYRPSTESPEQRRRRLDGGAVRRKRARLLLLQWADSYKAAHGCEDCGAREHFLLEFHHRDPKKKTGTISIMIAKLSPLLVVMKEIELCAVLCGNCHKRRHYESVKESRLPLLPPSKVRFPWEGA